MTGNPTGSLSPRRKLGLVNIQQGGDPTIVGINRVGGDMNTPVWAGTHRKGLVSIEAQGTLKKMATGIGPLKATINIKAGIGVTLETEILIGIIVTLGQDGRINLGMEVMIGLGGRATLGIGIMGDKLFVIGAGNLGTLPGFAGLH